MSTKTIGDYGEKLAVKYLKKNKYKIIQTNYRVSFGEIDIIAKKDDVLCFVEVKTRMSDEFLRPSANVTIKKQQTIVKVANHYLFEHRLDVKTQFDVIEVVGKEINHIKGAFYAKSQI